MKKTIFYNVAIGFCTIIALQSCENENENLNVFGVDNLTTNTVEIPITAYTSVNDTVRTDERNLLVPIGVSQSSVFGNMNANFATQVNYTGTYGSSFGLNARYKKAEIIIPVLHNTLTSDEYTTLIQNSTTTVAFANDHTDKDTLVINYPVDSIYNVSANSMKIKVAKLNSKMNSFSSSYYSNGVSYLQGVETPAYTRGNQLGEFTIGNTVRDTIYASYDESTNSYSYNSKPATIAYRFELDAPTFSDLYNRIQSGSISNSTILKENFPGIEIYTEDTTGFNFMTTPTGIQIRIGVVYDNDTDGDGIPNATDTDCSSCSNVATTTNRYVDLEVGALSETRASTYLRNYTSAASSLINQMTNANMTDGERNLYIIGNGASQAVLKVNNTDPFTKISDNTYTSGLSAFFEQAKQNGSLIATISEAYIDVYVDESQAPVDAAYPYYLTLYDYDNKREIADYSQFSGLISSISNYKSLIGGTYDSENKKYRFKVTQHFKNILLGKTYTDTYDTDNDGDTTEELAYSNVLLGLAQGFHDNNPYITTENSSIYRTTRRYLPGNVALFGNSNDTKEIKLVVKYSFINN